ncbi:MAG: hypothetical protein C5B50_19445 [Verrucomicrobia bacterium]|nr:MAG: hypothetical protein C5B50_19445 [Verrucomicrobiota bacterium]
MDKKRIIIVGGGFGGVKCAQTLCRELAHEQVEVVLFNRENHLVFSPLLAEVVGSSINSLDVVVPLRQLLPRVLFRTEVVLKINLEKREIEFEGEDGKTAQMGCDHLVLACGNATDLNVVPGMADHAFPLKKVGDAAFLRAHIMERMEDAEVAASAERRQWHLTFLIVGGGFSGVEVAGEINDLVRSSARYFRNWKRSDARVILVHARDQILPEISPSLREFARKKMEKAGVEILLNARVNSATPEGVGLQGGRFLKGATIVCTVGNSAAPLIAALNSPKEKGRLVTEADMRVKNASNIWAIGDCAYIVNSLNGQASPTTGQFAERQGRQCAQNIVRALRGEPARPFEFKAVGELCSIGGHKAVADIFGLHLSGFLAWFVWRGVYLFKLPTIGRRMQVGFDWATLLVFPRDLAAVRIEQTDRVSHAHYDAGDYIIRKGEAPTHFYVLEQGEVEVLRPQDQDGADGELVTVLGAGSFFGERALLGNRPRVMSVRARTPVEVLVLGKNLFTQMSGALGPLKDALAQTLNRRSLDHWKEEPQVHDLLRGSQVKDLMEPIPQPLLEPDTTMREVGQAFVDHPNEFFFVSSEGQTLEGVITITDLLRGRAAGAGVETKASDFMTKNPVTVAADDDCALAGNTFREYRLKTLPVVETKGSKKLAGCVRIRKLMAFVLKEGRAGVPPAQSGGTPGGAPSR